MNNNQTHGVVKNTAGKVQADTGELVGSTEPQAKGRQKQLAFKAEENGAIKGHFYCPFDPITRQIHLTIKAASVEEAQQRMAALGPLAGLTETGEFSYVVLEEAPRGVPLFAAPL